MKINHFGDPTYSYFEKTVWVFFSIVYVLKTENEIKSESFLSSTNICFFKQWKLRFIKNHNKYQVTIV